MRLKVKYDEVDVRWSEDGVDAISPPGQDNWYYPGAMFLEAFFGIDLEGNPDQLEFDYTSEGPA